MLSAMGPQSLDSTAWGPREVLAIVGSHLLIHGILYHTWDPVLTSHETPPANAWHLPPEMFTSCGTQPSHTWDPSRGAYIRGTPPSIAWDLSIEVLASRGPPPEVLRCFPSPAQAALRAVGRSRDAVHLGHGHGHGHVSMETWART